MNSTCSSISFSRDTWNVTLKFRCRESPCLTCTQASTKTEERTRRRTCLSIQFWAYRAQGPRNGPDWTLLISFLAISYRKRTFHMTKWPIDRRREQIEALFHKIILILCFFGPRHLKIILSSHTDSFCTIFRADLEGIYRASSFLSVIKYHRVFRRILGVYILAERHRGAHRPQSLHKCRHFYW